MAGFLYYLPNCQRPPADVSKLPAEAAALAPLLEGIPLGWGHVHNGPGGTSGYLIAPQPASKDGEAADCRYKPETQTWHDAGKWWVGWETLKPPRPEDLQRDAVTHRGHGIMLGGHEWIVSTIHVSRTTLPRGYVVTPEGEPQVVPDKRYHAIMEEASYWYDVSFGGGPWNPTMAEAFAFAARVLGINYRVGAVECSQPVLDILRSDTVFGVIGAAIGAIDIENEQKARRGNVIPPAT